MFYRHWAYVWNSYFSTAFKIEIILSWLLVLQLAIYMCFPFRVRQILGDKIGSAPLSLFHFSAYVIYLTQLNTFKTFFLEGIFS